jgi:hypothetical protein
VDFAIDIFPRNFLNFNIMMRYLALLPGLAFLASSSLVGGPMGYPSSSTTVRSTTFQVEETPLYNTTLLNEKILAKKVVCRSRWGTPMPPDGKGGYNLIQKVVPKFVDESNIIPPLTDGPVYRVKATEGKVIVTTEPVPTPVNK